MKFGLVPGSQSSIANSVKLSIHCLSLLEVFSCTRVPGKGFYLHLYSPSKFLEGNVGDFYVRVTESCQESVSTLPLPGCQV